MENMNIKNGFQYYTIKLDVGCYCCDTFDTVEEAKEALKEYRVKHPKAKIVAKLEVEID